MPLDGTTNSTLLTLRMLRDLLAHCWTQDAFARDANGLVTEAHSDSATTFCILGGLGKITGTREWAIETHDVAKLLKRRVRARGYEDVPEFNDSITTRHEDVLAFLDETIAIEGGN